MSQGWLGVNIHPPHANVAKKQKVDQENAYTLEIKKNDVRFLCGMVNNTDLSRDLQCCFFSQW